MLIYDQEFDVSKEIRIILIYFLFLFSILIFTALQREPWLDDYWSLFLSGSDLSLSDVFLTRWLVDVHPPLFSGINFVVGQFSSISVTEGRLLNLIPFLLMAGYLFFLFRITDSERPFIFIFFISITSTYFFEAFFSVFRSYFTGITSFSILLICIYMIYCADIKNITERRTVFSGLFISLFICLNIHYVTALITSILIFVFIVDFVVRKNYKIALYLSIISIASAIPPFVFLVVQRIFISDISHKFWITTSFQKGILTIIGVAGTGATNPVLLISGLVLFSSALYGIIRKRANDENLKLRYCILLVISLILVSITIITMNFVVPFIISTYIAPIGIIITSILCVNSSNFIYLRIRIMYIFLLFAILFLLVNGLFVYRKPGWAESSEFIRSHIADCSTSIVYPAMLDDEPAPNAMLNRDFAYKNLAASKGFSVEPLNSSRVPSPSEPCPALIWTAHGGISSEMSDSIITSAIISRFPQFKSCSIIINRDKITNTLKIPMVYCMGSR